MAPRGGSWVLAVILSLTLVAVDAPLLHQHDDTGPAWYDEECSSIHLAAGRGDPGILPVVDHIRSLPPLEVMVPATSAGRPPLSLLSTGPRGPPIAS